MVIQFPRKLRTFRDRQDDTILEILQVISDELGARDYDIEPWLDEFYSLLEDITEPEEAPF